MGNGLEGTTARNASVEKMHRVRPITSKYRCDKRMYRSIVARMSVASKFHLVFVRVRVAQKINRTIYCNPFMFKAHISFMKNETRTFAFAFGFRSQKAYCTRILYFLVERSGKLPPHLRYRKSIAKVKLLRKVSLS